MSHTDLVLAHGSIWSLDPALPRPEALLVRAGRVVESGSAEMIKAAAKPGYEFFDLQGRSVVPGLCDAHIHLLWTALVAKQVDLDGVASLAQALDRVRAHADTLPHDAWVLGHGWDHSLWGGRWPTAEDLDAVTGGRPTWLTRKDLHSAWCNSAALARAGVTDDRADPPGGHIGRAADAQRGLLFEDAQQLVRVHIPAPSPAQKEQAIAELTEQFLAHGVTSVQVPEGPDCFAAVQALYARGELKVRVLHHLQLSLLDSAIELGLHSGLGDHWLRVGGLKIFSDGSLGSQTAWMKDPYAISATASPNYGMPLFEPQALNALVERAALNHLSVIVHAIGDAANAMVLDAIEHVLRKQQAPLQSPQLQPTVIAQQAFIPHRIEHAQILDSQDIRRFAQLGVIASVQPIHATSDMDVADELWGARCATAYAWRSLLDSGATLAFGSDAPVEAWNPWWGIHAAVSRKLRVAGSRCWYEQQCLDLHEALWGYTIGPAIASGEQSLKGSLAPGKLADLVVLDTDLEALAVDDLHTVKPVATMVEGAWAWEK